MEVTYTNEDGSVVSSEDVYNKNNNAIYFSVNYVINSVIESSGAV